MRRRPAWNGDGTTVAVETDQAELRSDATSRAAKKAGRKAVPKKVGLPLSGRRGLLPLRPPDHGSAGIAKDTERHTPTENRPVEGTRHPTSHDVPMIQRK